MTERVLVNGATSWQSKVGERPTQTVTDFTNELIKKKYAVGRWDNYSYKTTALVKGRASELICLRYFKELEDCKVSYHSEGKHEIDFTVTEDASVNPYTYFVEAKFMTMSQKYRNYGINAYQYKNYRLLQDRTGISVKIYFVDYHLGACVGNYLDILDQPYERVNRYGPICRYPLVVKYTMKTGEVRDMIHFPVEYTKKIFDLLPEEIERMESLVR